MKLIPITQDGKTVYKCECCDKIYETLPLCFGAEAPAYCNTIPHEEREQRIQLDKSWCIVDDKYFFHRGNLIIPIIDSEEELVFGVWTSISQENFEKRMDLWDNPDRVNEEPYFGWLQTNVPGYGSTLSIKTIAQENGITMKRVLDILSIILKH